MTAFIFLLMLGLPYLAACTAAGKPERAVYGYMLIWLFSPKFIQKVPLLGGLPWPGITVFEIVEAIGMFTLAVVCLTHGRRRSFFFSGQVRFFIWGFLGMTLCTFCYVMLVTQERLFNQPGFLFRYFAYPTLVMAYASIFAVACMRYLDTFEKIEKGLFLLALSGVELTLEVVLLHHGHLIPYLQPWVEDSARTGRFASLAFLSFDTVGLMQLINICCIVYFILIRRKWIYFMFVPILALPIVATLSKGPFTGLILALITILSLMSGRKRGAMLLFALMPTLGVFFLAPTTITDLPNYINQSMGGVTRDDDEIQGTLNTRLGLWLRGADVFIYNFPFGAGNGMVELNLSAFVPAHFDNYVRGDVANVYAALSNKEKVTNAHNELVEFVAENGVLAIPVLTAFAVMLGRNFIRFLRTPLPNPASRAWRFYAAQACIYGALVGMGWRYMYESSDKIFFLLFLFFYSTYLLPELQRQADLPKRTGESPQGRRHRWFRQRSMA